MTAGPLPHRVIQVGLSGEAVERYVEEWIVRISDVTDLAQAVHRDVGAGRLGEAASRLPQEVPYPLPEEIRERIGGTATNGEFPAGP
ncbi:hypothetical protein GCM10010420_45600 [Streptomyces glaucosporus]|uniref:Uncharacterized protein n=1 Tax=Streptomyces glaucosporus TaxID=284044 RepID=A0ABN3IS38_9ACTN